MGLFRWICQNICQREYPLICVPRFPRTNVPYASFCPNKISFTFSKLTKSIWGIDGDNISDIIEEVLEHELLHIVINWRIGFQTTHQLNNVNRFEMETNKLMWMFRDGKTFGHLLPS